ncbi:MAG: hypothetical protein HYU39_01430 [Thaumarchaeota archaeon]|nr:hypothetical protein [Nitrososphaerota archaeon]
MPSWTPERDDQKSRQPIEDAHHNTHVGTYVVSAERVTLRTVRRSLLERYIDILHAVRSAGQIRKTRILYRANLTWDEMKIDLQHLLHAGLIREFLWKEGIFYAITDLGLQALRHYEDLNRSLQLRSLSDI